MMLAWRGEGSKGVEGPIDNGGGGDSPLAWSRLGVRRLEIISRRDGPSSITAPR